MKILKVLLASVVLCSFMPTSGFSLSLSSSEIEVGEVDRFIASASMGDNSSEAAEVEWINGILSGLDEFTDSVEKIEEDLPIYLVDGTIYAVDISTETDSDTDYFLVKNSTYWALFENLDNIDWGVFDAAVLPDGMIIPGDDLTVSHVTLVDSENVSGSGGYVGHAPEPSTFLLFGAGLLGLAKISRRKKSFQR